MKDALVIILYDHPIEHTSDYCTQTSNYFKKNNYVIDVLLKDTRSLKELIFLGQSYRFIQRISSRHVVITPFAFIPFIRFRFVRKINILLNIFLLRIFLSIFQSMMKKVSGKYVWIFNPEQTVTALSFDSAFHLVYDCVDHHRDKETSNREGALLKRCNTIVVNSHSLYCIYKNIRNDVTIVPLGFDVKAFSVCRSVQPAIPKRSKKIIGYIGGINSRLDFELLTTVIKSNSQVRFVFVGQIQQREATAIFQNEVLPKISAVLALPNVQYIPYVSRSCLPSYISKFTICMIPYDISLEFNRLSYPMKVMEYMYFGKPIISTPIEEFRFLSKYISLCDTSLDWNLSIRRLLNTSLSKRQRMEMKIYAKKQSWDRKFESIVKHVDSREPVLI